MKLTNKQIYEYAEKILKIFSVDEEIYLPIRINFYLHKNRNILMELAKDIEKQRTEIIKKYGTLNEETKEYEVPKDKITDVLDEIDELFSLTQDVTLYFVSMNEIKDDLTLTTQQMDALMFMIED